MSVGLIAVTLKLQFMTFTIATVKWRIINLVLRISQLTLTSTTHLKESQKILSMFQRRKPNKKIAKEV